LYRWTEDACACNDCTSLRSYSWCFPWCISSFVNDASWSPRSCRYMQSGFGQAWLRIKCEQYFVVPNDVFIVRPSTTMLFTASIARSASSWRCYNTKNTIAYNTLITFVYHLISKHPWNKKTKSYRFKENHKLISNTQTHLISNISRSTGALRPCIGSTLVNYDFVYLPKFSKIFVFL